MTSDSSSTLCFECGLCCNGVIFSRGQLQPSDNPERLKVLGLMLSPAKKPKATLQKFQQPCGAFDGCRCRIYSDRPQYCRQFECLLLKNVQAGRLESTAASRIIRLARRRAEKVQRLLRELGDSDEHVALSLRFQKTRRRIESGPLDEETAATFGQLTLAVHDLNVLLSEAFYSNQE